MLIISIFANALPHAAITAGLFMCLSSELIECRGLVLFIPQILMPSACHTKRHSSKFWNSYQG